MKIISAFIIALLLSLPVSAEEWQWAENLPRGKQLPLFSALDSDGKTRISKDLAGENGMLLLFNRSTVW